MKEGTVTEMNRWNRKLAKLAPILALLILFVIAVAVFSKMDEKNISSIERGLKSSGYNLPLATVHIEGDPNDFYGEEEGILVSGKLFEEYKRDLIEKGKISEAEAEELVPNELMEANFNHKDWVKTCGITIVDANGKELVKEQVGLRISGNASRKLAQKSFVIIADKRDYGSKSNELTIPFPDETVTQKRFRIHAGGQDLRDTQIRDELISAMAKKCGFSLTRKTMPVMVFINDNFYGIAHLENSINEAYVASEYGLKKKKIEMVSEGIVEAQEALGFPVEEDHDFNDPEVSKRLESVVDVKDMLRYFAFNMMIDNYDWPHNNVVMWRYTGNEKEDIPETDGRYRFILSDIDVSLKGDVKDVFSDFFWDDTIPSFKFLRELLENPTYKEYFVNAVMDQITLCWSEEFLRGEVARIEAGYGDAFCYAYENTSDETLKGYLANHDDSVREMLEYSGNRLSRIYDILYQYLDTGEGYILIVKAPTSGTIYASDIPVRKEDVESLRSRGCTMPVTYKGKKSVEGWLVNGEPVSGEKLILSADDVIDKRVEIEVLLK